MGRDRRSTETARLGSGPQPGAVSPTRPRTSRRPSRGGRGAAVHRVPCGFPDASSSLRLPRTARPESCGNRSANATGGSRGRTGPGNSQSPGPRLESVTAHQLLRGVGAHATRPGRGCRSGGSPFGLLMEGESTAQEAPMRKGVQRITRYVSILANSRIGSVNRYDEEASKAAGRPKGSTTAPLFGVTSQPKLATRLAAGAIGFIGVGVFATTVEERDSS